MKIHKAILIKSSDKLMVRVWDSDDNVKYPFGYREYEVHHDYVHLSVLFTNEELEKGVVLDHDLIELTDSYAILKDKPIESEGENIDGLWYDAWRLAQGKDCLDYIMELKEKYTLKRK